MCPSGPAVVRCCCCCCCCCHCAHPPVHYSTSATALLFGRSRWLPLHLHLLYPHSPCPAGPGPPWIDQAPPRLPETLLLPARRPLLPTNSKHTPLHCCTLTPSHQFAPHTPLALWNVAPLSSSTHTLILRARESLLCPPSTHTPRTCLILTAREPFARTLPIILAGLHRLARSNLDTIPEPSIQSLAGRVLYCLSLRLSTSTPRVNDTSP